MADKEATVYVVDLGKSMGENRHGRDESDLDWAMKYVWDKIAATVSMPVRGKLRISDKCQKMATGRKSLCAGVVGFRTDGINFSDLSASKMNY